MSCTVLITSYLLKARAGFEKRDRASLGAASGLLEVVHFMEPTTKATGEWRVDDKRPSVALNVRAWLHEICPPLRDDWPPATRSPPVLFVGFRPRLFLRALAAECALVPIKGPTHLSLPLLLAPEAHVFDLAEAAWGSGGISPPEAVRAFGVEPIASWHGPGNDADEDQRLALELSSRYGFMRAATGTTASPG